MPSGARLAFVTSHRLVPHAETDVSAARLIELLTEAEPHAVLGTCVPLERLACLFALWGPLRHSRRHGFWVPLPFFSRLPILSHLSPATVPHAPDDCFAPGCRSTPLSVRIVLLPC